MTVETIIHLIFLSTYIYVCYKKLVKSIEKNQPLQPQVFPMRSYGQGPWQPPPYYPPPPVK